MAKKISNNYSYEEYIRLIEKIADFVIENNATTRETANYFTSTGTKISYVTVSNLLNSSELQRQFPSKYEKVQAILKHNSSSKVIDSTDTLVRIQNAMELSLRGYTVPQIAEILNSTEATIYNDLTSRLKKLNSEELNFLISTELEEHRISNLRNINKR